MRKSLVLGLLGALLASAVPVRAQTPAPARIISENRATSSILNSTTALNLYKVNLGAQPTSGAAAPLHLRLLGMLRTNPSRGSVGTVTILCSYGNGTAGTSASLTIANALDMLDDDLTNSPYELNLYIKPLSWSTPAYSKQMMFGSIEYASKTTSSPTLPMAFVGKAVRAIATNTTANMAAANQLNCKWTWASGSVFNSVYTYGGILQTGN